jgi:hypothetical protein
MRGRMPKPTPAGRPQGREPGWPESIRADATVHFRRTRPVRACPWMRSRRLNTLVNVVSSSFSPVGRLDHA